MKHEPRKKVSPATAKLSIVVEKLEKKIDKAAPVATTCSSTGYCVDPG
jgi:hypothetical protein